MARALPLQMKRVTYFGTVPKELIRLSENAARTVAKSYNREKKG